MPDLGTADSIGCKESQSNFKNPRRTKCSVDIFKDSLGFSAYITVLIEPKIVLWWKL